MRCMMVLGTRSLMDLLMMPMYESTRLRMVSTCRSNWGSIENVSAGAASSTSVWATHTDNKGEALHALTCDLTNTWTLKKHKAAPSYLVLLRIHSSPEERCFPAVHILLRITGQFYLTKILVDISEHTNNRETQVVVNVYTRIRKNTITQCGGQCAFSPVKKQHNPDLCSVLKIPKVCFVDIKPFSTSLSFRLSSGSIYFFSFS